MTNQQVTTYGTTAEYRQWISDFAIAIGNRKTVVILESDALPQLDCLSTEGKQTQFNSSL